MAYQTIDDDDQDEALIAFVVSQERDHHSHTLNKQRYEAMLITLPDGPFKTRVLELLTQTNSRLSDIDAILAATAPQMPPPARVAASVARMKAKGRF